MAFTLWFTGLPGSGKTTIAGLLGQRLAEKGLKIEILDSDEISRYYTGLFPFDTSGRKIIAGNMAVCAEMLNRNGISVLAAGTVPMSKDRERLRSVISEFFLVYCNASEQTVRKRDPKGLYKMADKGIIENFPGPGGVYEIPEDADFEIDSGNSGMFRCVEDLIYQLCKQDLLKGLI